MQLVQRKQRKSSASDVEGKMNKCGMPTVEPNISALLATTTNGATPPVRDQKTVVVHSVGSQRSTPVYAARMAPSELFAEQTDRAVNIGGDNTCS